jgi:phenylalanyl-tRNA synthetase beta chain
MKVPLSWLKEYVDVEISHKELAEKLTFAGLEVKSLEQIKDPYEGIVVAEILDIQPHPNADRLLLCRINDGEREHNIVCGARNMSVGDKVPFIRAGYSLPDGTKIRKAVIRGKESDGMLCSERELGISDNHSGIMILPRTTITGTPFGVLYGGVDYVFDIEVTWNRPDLLSVIGIAREVAAITGKKIHLPEVNYREDEDRINSYIDVDVLDNQACPRYVARVVREVKLQESPLWLKRRLEACGIRAISNIVDITNYVMLECGQPLHAFDIARLRGRKIIVRKAKEGERIKLLDGSERELTVSDLVIADEEIPVALAGVMGGEDSGINDTTSQILIESACFNPVLISNTARRLRISTESSMRFERGIDIVGVDWASRRAISLIQQIAGGHSPSGSIDIFLLPPETRRISCQFQRISNLLGIEVPREKVVSIFTGLELKVEMDANGTGCSVTIPAFRGDLKCEADLIEEVARIYGLDKIPERPSVALISQEVDDTEARNLIRFRSLLSSLGLHEISNYSFTSHKLLDFILGSDSRENRIELPNPSSADYAVLRPSLIPQMLETLGRNRAREVENVAFFEIGRVFERVVTGELHEEERLCIGLMGRIDTDGIGCKKEVEDEESFLWLKGIIETFARQVCANVKFSMPDGISKLPLCFRKETSLQIMLGDKIIGHMGIVKEEIRKEWRIWSPVAVAEIELKDIKRSCDILKKPELPPVYPSVIRDIAMIVDESVTHEKILNIIRDNAPQALTDIKLFDIFRDVHKIGAGKKSMAYSLRYCLPDRTLTDEEANMYHEHIKEVLKKNLAVEIRES